MKPIIGLSRVHSDIPKQAICFDSPVMMPLEFPKSLARPKVQPVRTIIFGQADKAKLCSKGMQKLHLDGLTHFKVSIMSVC